MAEREYAELVAKAEKAVASVKDPELKRIAFQKVLDDLIGVHTESPHKPLAPKRAVARAKGNRPHASGPRTYIKELIDEDFFKKPKTITNVKAELENRGHHIPLTSLSGPLQRLCQAKILRRQRTKASGNRETFSYSNW